jgi:Mce-associated membrane protein
VVAVSIAVALASVTVAGVVLVTQPRTAGAPAGGSEAELRRAALDAARAATVSLTSYDHRTLDEDFGRVSAIAVGDFAKEYAETSAALRPTLEQTQAVATSQVPAVGIEELQTDPVRVVAVVAVDQVIRTAGAEPRTELNRLRMTLVRPDQTWLVERVQRL